MMTDDFTNVITNVLLISHIFPLYIQIFAALTASFVS